jgi:catechol 2,3-dioxygenase-like lactoylglutathione lyase family enzyme
MRLGQRIAALMLLFAWIFSPKASAQLFPTAPPDHLHMAVPDPDKTIDWYVQHFEGKRIPDPRPLVNGRRPPDEIGFDKVAVRFFKRDGATPTAGSVLDRIGFTVSDVDAKVAEVVSDGGKVLTPARDVPGLKIRVAFLQDPWGTTIEIFHDPDLPNRLHLIALRAPDPEPLMKWVSETFGGTRGKYQGRFEGLRYGDLWLMIQKSEGEVAPSVGHTLDHLGWPVPNVNEAITQLKNKGYKITSEVARPSPPLVFLSYLEGPSGLTVELTQFPDSASK